MKLSTLMTLTGILCNHCFGAAFAEPTPTQNTELPHLNFNLGAPITPTQTTLAKLILTEPDSFTFLKPTCKKALAGDANALLLLNTELNDYTRTLYWVRMHGTDKISDDFFAYSQTQEDFREFIFNCKSILTLNDFPKKLIRYYIAEKYRLPLFCLNNLGLHCGNHKSPYSPMLYKITAIEDLILILLLFETQDPNHHMSRFLHEQLIKQELTAREKQLLHFVYPWIFEREIKNASWSPYSADILKYKLSEFDQGTILLNTKKKKDEGLKLIHSAAEAGDPFAQKKLGYLHERGIYVELSPEKAFDWYKKAAKLGDPEAQFKIGHFYQTGINGKIDEQKSALWYFRSILSINNLACLTHIENQEISYGCSSSIATFNPETSLLSLKASRLPNLDLVISAFSKYTNYFFLKQPDEKHLLNAHGFFSILEGKYYQAVELFTKSTHKKNPDALNSLGWLYQTGRGVKPNPHKAHALYARAIGLGHEQAYINNRKLEKDFLDAVLADLSRLKDPKTIEMLKKLNHPCLIDEFYHAVDGYQKKAYAGDADAAYNLGCWYDMSGVFEIPQDTIEAIFWYRAASLLTLKEAGTRFSELFVSQSFLDACTTTVENAASNEADAQYHLGLLYECGLHVAKNTSEAFEQFRLAAKQGHKKAQERIKHWDDRIAQSTSTVEPKNPDGCVIS